MLVLKNPPASTGDVRDVSSIPGSGVSPGGGNGNPLTIHRVAKSQTRLRRLSMYTYIYIFSFSTFSNFEVSVIKHKILYKSDSILGQKTLGSSPSSPMFLLKCRVKPPWSVLSVFISKMMIAMVSALLDCCGDKMN